MHAGGGGTAVDPLSVKRSKRVSSRTGLCAVVSLVAMIAGSCDPGRGVAQERHDLVAHSVVALTLSQSGGAEVRLALCKGRPPEFVEIRSLSRSSQATNPSSGSVVWSATQRDLLPPVVTRSPSGKRYVAADIVSGMAGPSIYGAEAFPTLQPDRWYSFDAGNYLGRIHLILSVQAFRVSALRPGVVMFRGSSLSPKRWDAELPRSLCQS
jgi:hypothetical protein